jgi:hypothetical protein
MLRVPKKNAIMLSLSYQSLGDFTGLPDVRKAIARGDRGLLVFDLPAFKKEASIENLVSLSITGIAIFD